MKILSIYEFKNNLVNGTPSKIKVWLSDDGVMVIRVRCLSKKKIPQYKKIYSKFNTHLHERTMSMKYSTMQFILKTSTQVLLKHKIKPENIL
jgi:hypothetical protein